MFTEDVVPPHCHAVSFFEDDRQLCAEVGLFVSDGLAANEPALVVTTPTHRAGIAAELATRGVDLAAAVAAGDLLLLDAEETLRSIVKAGKVDPATYQRSLDEALTGLLRGRPGPVRIFGDMVDVLWRRGEHENAIRIEVLSNQLAATHPITVICGYSLGHFLKSTTKAEAIHALHGRVHAPAPTRT